MGPGFTIKHTLDMLDRKTCPQYLLSSHSKHNTEVFGQTLDIIGNLKPPPNSLSC
ncbi:hypothetical protein CCP3SC1_1400002 [Gammaproteobacteria bacterium]